MTNTPKFSLTKNKTHYCVAFIICLIGAFTIYALSYYMREILRLFSIDWYYRTIFTLNENVHFFYNFFYATFSCIIAFNVFLLYVFNRPKQFMQGKRYLQLASVHDLRFTSWLFVFYFITIFFDWWMFTKGNFHDFSFTKNYWYFFVLILLVLFFNSQSSLQRILPNRSFKYLFISLIGILLVSLSFTFVKFADYAEFEQKFNQKNVYSQYDYLQLYSSSSQPLNNITWSIPLFLIKDEQKNEISVYSTFHPDPIENLATFLRDSIAIRYSEIEMQLLEPNLHFNADLTMSEYFQVYQQIKKGLGSGKVAYAINAGNIKRYIFKDNLTDITNVDKEILNSQDTIRLTQTAKQKLELNGVAVGFNKLKSLLWNEITKKENPVINFTIHPDCNFTDYLATKSILSTLKKRHLIQQLDDFNFQIFEIKKEEKPSKNATLKIIHQLLTFNE